MNQILMYIYSKKVIPIVIIK